ncbi:hypothetical protein D3C81_1741040 [compost metagenome]
MTCPEYGQHRLQRVINRQQMRQTAAHEERKHDFAGEAFLRNQIEEGLQYACVRGLIHRANHDYRVRLSYKPIGFDNGFALEFGVNQVLRRQLGYINPLHFETASAQIPLSIFDDRVNP